MVALMMVLIIVVFRCLIKLIIIFIMVVLSLYAVAMKTGPISEAGRLLGQNREGIRAVGSEDVLSSCSFVHALSAVHPSRKALPRNVLLIQKA